jgi:hypothetical protein
MSEYRDDARNVAKEARWTVFRFFPLFVLVIAILAGTGFALNSLGVFGRTVVERKVFENSYQRTAALEERIAVDTASLTEIERQLLNPNLDADTRFNLEAQAAAARVRIQTARSQQ